MCKNRSIDIEILSLFDASSFMVGKLFATAPKISIRV